MVTYRPCISLDIQQALSVRTVDNKQMFESGY